MTTTFRFREQYRLPRSLAMKFVNNLDGFMDPVDYLCPDIPLTVLFCSVLNFYASGSYQRRVGGDAFTYMSQTCVSPSIRSISRVIATKMMNNYVRFPQTLEEIEQLEAEMQLIMDFPGVFALVDGSQIDLAALERAIEFAFVNRKWNHSINTQFIVSAGMRILSINARFPGSTHDSLIWRSSLANATLRDMAMNVGPNWNYVLLGDTGYPLLPWLLTPYESTNTWEQLIFNICHQKLRSLVKRVIGLFKARFRCCLKERKLRYGPLMSGYIIYSCAVLHNFLLDNNYPVDDLEPIFEDDLPQHGQISLNEFNRGGRIRDNIARYFVNSNYKNKYSK